MKSVRVFLVVLALIGGVATTAFGAAMCPLAPIITYPNGTLYICDYYDPDCDAEPEVGYMFGEYNWPYKVCPDDCEQALDATGPGPDVDATFPGLLSYVEPTYMHRYLVYGPLPGQKKGESCFPVGLAREICSVNPKLNNQFVKVVTQDSPSQIRYAKVLEIRFNPPAALEPIPSEQMTENASQSKSDCRCEGKWRSRYVAFEVVEDPRLVGGDVADLYRHADQTGMGSYAVRGSFKLQDGKMVSVLILLRRDPSKNQYASLSPSR